MSRGQLTAILAAGGLSVRMGVDKLWIDLWGRPTWRWSLDTLLAAPSIERVAVVAPADGIDLFRSFLPAEAADRCLVVAGGSTRADSVIAGIWALTRAGYDDETVVLVHDAARPAVSGELIDRVAAAAAEGSAVIPVVPVVDSLKRVRSERVAGSVEREDVAAAQTPQAARLGALRAAIEEAHAWGRPITDDAGALAAAGVSVRVVPGDPANRKLTGPEDVVALRALLAQRAALASLPVANAEARVGIGFDAHRLEAGRRMRLAGVDFADEPMGPLGHSDGDAALHALSDALLGAAALGDLGAMFPSDDPASVGADSAELLAAVVARLREAGWAPSTVDLTIAAARPPIATHRHEIMVRLAGLLGVPPTAVSVKGTTSDGLGYTGAEGIAAWAVASIAPVAASAAEPATGPSSKERRSRS
jgi:2-C-methyl-D-erythritol 4-phosphate cytidylyltransferase/2-C-methyl-D-erythritol 2,4-cyclodiphosphate synthase